MSATRDKSQRIGFVTTNLYQLYQKGKAAAQAAQVPMPPPAPPRATATEALAKAASALPPSSRVLKAKDLKDPTFAHIRVSKAAEASFIGKRTEARAETVSAPVETEAKVLAPMYAQKPEVLAQNDAIESLKRNLNSLNDLHARLRFMLEELEDLVKD